MATAMTIWPPERPGRASAPRQPPVRVNVILGAGGGLSSTGNQLWTQNSAGVLDSAEAGDSFGAALAAGDVDRDGHADMAIGVPDESVGAAAAGCLNLLYGSAGGLTSAANQLWSQDTPNILESPRRTISSRLHWRRGLAERLRAGGGQARARRGRVDPAAHVAARRLCKPGHKCRAPPDNG